LSVYISIEEFNKRVKSTPFHFGPIIQFSKRPGKGKLSDGCNQLSFE